ncbi:hypothetical protein Rumeso_03770 [Rubellimicrobium mesophilum DSM 19309]|uniref:Uncharacterized protein n=1 Tax=Rubellimicrobium mesophilum DSM 19309 TaxID=442562 RepID=A0A017HKM6_9RHOB|nr:hypothetical protein [Rubellimicrobium mesophilum]EYD74713.1 hypothetical protein Rumeso_03770 [Rubellimicrobium mesophilum DSM 19309]
MKTLLLSTTLAALTLGALPVLAGGSDGMTRLTAAGSTFQGPGLGADEFDRRGRRVRGGSGCDDPRDLIEHPECR